MLSTGFLVRGSKVCTDTVQQASVGHIYTPACHELSVPVDKHQVYSHLRELISRWSISFSEQRLSPFMCLYTVSYTLGYQSDYGLWILPQHKVTVIAFLNQQF